MTRESVRELQSSDRRRWNRIALIVPVHIQSGTERTSAAVSAVTVQSKDVSPGGVYVTTSAGGVFVPGEILTVTVPVPWESRRAFPFSLMTGLCRVVRVDELSTINEEPSRGVALAFCGESTTLLGAIVTAV